MAISTNEIIRSEDISSILSTLSKHFNYITGKTLIPLDELESPIGLRVAGGGVIFYDDTVGFKGGTTKPSNKNGSDIPANALATRWGVSATYHDYAYDVLRGCVVRTSTLGTCNRFMVVGENDMISEARGSMKTWDISSAASTSRSTNTAFGYGSANTSTLCSVITDSTTIWPTVQYFRYSNPQGPSNAADNALDTRWFVPSRDELCVLFFMFYHDSSHRPTTGIYSRQLQLPFYTYCWSSSQIASNATYAWISDAYRGSMGSGNKGGTSGRVRLCRTF